MIPRILKNRVKTALSAPKRKVICLLGPRQVGKTTLLRGIFDELEGRKEFLNADFADDRALLRAERASLERLAKHLDYLFIDEAQNIPDAGRVLKLLHDEFPRLRVAASGSAAIDLRRQTGEPLTGRQTVFEMYPVCLAELEPGAANLRLHMENGLIHGGYPEVLETTAPMDRERLLRQLAADYLLKDILAQVEVNRDRVEDLLRLLAFQIGSETSLNELATATRMDVKTVDRYLGLLESARVILRLGAFSRNLRKEIAKSRKIFFVDLGIRNALINAFNPPPLRDDMGRLWENYLIVERRKRLAYSGETFGAWFWRTYDRQEIDYIEERGGRLSAFEFKWGSGRKSGRLPKLWSETYPDSQERIVTPDNAADFLLGPERAG